jgi:leader peptidase (prepilin peptidase) / N-methyltransferase
VTSLGAVGLYSPMIWMVFILGASIGSFLNVCIIRIPLGTFFKGTRSQCPQCGTKIAFYDNIPIFSYLFLRAKARCCSARISIRYPLVEIFTALIFVVIYWTYPFVEQYSAHRVFDQPQLIRCVYVWVFASLMIVCSIIDIDHMIIPDVVSKPMIVAGPMLALIHPDLRVTSSVFGILLGGGVLYAVGWGYYLVRRRVGMGFGDVKLLAAIGAWLGYEAVLPTLFIGSMIGTVLGLGYMAVKRQAHLGTEVPFGPFLCSAALIHQLFGAKLMEYLYGY